MHAAGSNAQRTIARLWDLHVTAIRDRSPAAARLLGVLAMYAPDAIPRPMLGGTATREDTDEALGLLASYSMITLTAGSVSIHRLLQAVILTWHGHVPGDDARSLRDTALDWLATAIPESPDTNVAAWPLLRALVPHAETLASHFPPGDQPEDLGWLQGEIALFLHSQGDYAQTRPLQQSVLAIYEAALGPSHPITAVALNNLAATYYSLGRLADALPLQQRALAITETALGPDHPDTANRLDNLAMHLQQPGTARRRAAPAAAGAGHHRNRPGTRPPQHGPPAGQPRRHLQRPGADRRRAAPAAAGAGHHRNRPGTRPPRHGHPAGQPRRHLPRPGADRRRAAPAAAGAGHHRNRPGTRPPRHGHPAGQPRRHLPRPGADRRRAAPAAAGAGHHRNRPGTRPPRHGHPAGQPRRHLQRPGADRRRAAPGRAGRADPPTPWVSIACGRDTRPWPALPLAGYSVLIRTERAVVDSVPVVSLSLVSDSGSEPGAASLTHMRSNAVSVAVRYTLASAYILNQVC